MSGTIGDGTEEVDQMISDGTALYFNNNGGDEANVSYKWEKWSISGTTLTEVSDITCGADDDEFAFACMDSSGNFYGLDSGDSKVRKYNSAGALQATSSTDYNSANGLKTFEGIPYVAQPNSAGTMLTFQKISL